MKSGADGGELHSLNARISVCAGHRGEPGVRGRGMCNMRCRYWIVFDHRTAKLTPSSEKVASRRHKCKFESKDVMLFTKRLDFRKKEKNATKQAAQKVTSSGKVKSICLNNWRRIAGVMGRFCLCVAPNTLFVPMSMCQEH